MSAARPCFLRIGRPAARRCQCSCKTQAPADRPWPSTTTPSRPTSRNTVGVRITREHTGRRICMRAHNALNSADRGDAGARNNPICAPRLAIAEESPPVQIGGAARVPVTPIPQSVMPSMFTDGRRPRLWTSSMPRSATARPGQHLPGQVPFGCPGRLAARVVHQVRPVPDADRAGPSAHRSAALGAGCPAGPALQDADWLPAVVERMQRHRF